MRHKRTYIWAYLDGKKLCEVIQAALDNNMMVADLKQKLIDENPGHEVTFKMATTVKNIPYARDDFWSRIPEDCKKAISELKRLKVHRLAAYDYEDNFADVWWLVLHEVDMWDEGEYRMEADANESDPSYMNRKQANTARKWLVKWEQLFIKYAKESDKWANPEHICFQKTPA